MDRQGGVGCRFAGPIVYRWPALTVLLSFCAVVGRTASVEADQFVVTQVADINPGVTTESQCLIEPWLCVPNPVARQRNGSPHSFTPLVDRLYFAASDLTGNRLYQTDGTNVSPVGDVQAPDDLTRLGYAVFMSGVTSGERELVRVDPFGVNVFDIGPGTSSSVPIRFNEFAGNLYFVASGEAGRELYRTDGTSVSLVADLSAAPKPTFEPNNFTPFGASLYFTASGSSGNELYRTNGSGATLVADIAAAGGSSYPDMLTPVGSKLYFRAQGPNGTQIYRTSAIGATQVTNFPSSVNAPNGLFAFQDKLFFRATGEFGSELYKTDGNSVELVADINPNGNSSPGPITIFGDEMYFRANDGVVGNRLFRTDGQAVFPIGDDIVVDSFADADDVYEFQGALFFGGRQRVGNQFLPGIFKTDGQTVTKLADVGPMTYGPQFTEFAGQLFFNAVGPNGRELYRSDGEGVYLVADINPNGDSDPFEFTQLGDELFFSATGPQGNELYKLSVVAGPSVLAGDYDNNGIVDAADFTVWRNLLGSEMSLFNETESLGVVDQLDYEAWKSNFGATLSQGAGAQLSDLAVPEPSTLLILATAGLILGCQGRRLGRCA